MGKKYSGSLNYTLCEGGKKFYFFIPVFFPQSEKTKHYGKKVEEEKKERKV